MCDTRFRGRVTLATAEDHTIHYGWWSMEGVRIDSVTCSVFRTPNSYTGEHVVEIGCHGGPIVVEQILTSLIEAGARLAEPGEFTKRAFLNRKLDLTQVEAVADLIHAQSRVGAQTAARQLAGGFTKRLAVLREHLLQVCGLLELELDFSEEDVEFVDRTALLAALDEGVGVAERLAGTAASAEILRSGLQVAVVGYPNAGKSSLFNAMLSKERAIVSDVPGTTRDYLEETVFIDGFCIRLIDTAGIRASDDVIEMQGVRLTKSLVEQSNVVLIVNDASKGLYHSAALASDIASVVGSRPMLVVQNKIDLVVLEKEQLSESDIAVSAVRGTGLSLLHDALANEARKNGDVVADVLVNARQASLLRSLASSLQQAINGVQEGLSMEYVAVDVRTAIRLLGDIAGETWSPDILETIFSRFCIGK